MVIKSVEIESFICYTSTDIELPTTGLTLVVGSNGSGKSTLIEAVAWCLYGRTLRGTMPAVGAKVTVNLADGTRVTRKRIAKAYQLALEVGGKDLSGQTTTETQTRLDAMLGPWERFAPTRLFARDFMAKFAAATDKERKTLLEEILGLERFDTALALAREDLRKWETEGHKANVAVSMGVEGIERQRELLSQLGDPNELARLEAAFQDAGDRVTIAADAYNQAIKDETEALDMLSEVTKRRGAAESRRGESLRSLAEIAAKTSRLASLTECPVCLQTVGPGAHVAIGKHFAALAEPLNTRRDEATTELKDLASQVDEVSEERALLHAQTEALRLRLHAAQAEHADLKGQLSACSRQVDAQVRAAEVLARMVLDHATQVTRLAEAHRQAKISQVAVQAFGLRGARVLLMGQALTVLERETNQVLRALGLGIQIALRTTSTLKSGKEVDELSVGLIGAGGGSYQAASSGERARVDVALLLGLASLLGGRGEGFLAFDEVFDTLDDEGIERVAEFLNTMADTRQVIVISHHTELRSLFPRGVVLRASKDDNGSTLTQV